MPISFKSLAVLLAVPFVLAGCKIESINYFPPTPANVRIVNVLTSTTPLNVTVNGVAAWSGLSFEAMTGYQEFANTSTTFSVTLAGASAPLLSQTFNLAGKQNYTLVIYGTVYAPQMGAMADTTTQAPSGKSSINLFMAAPVGNGLQLGFYPVDFYLVSPGQAIDDISPTFTAVQYTITNIFGAFSSGTYQMLMTVAGTKTIVYDSGPITLNSETDTDVIIYGRGSGMLTNVLFDDMNGASQQIIVNNKLARLKVVNSAFQTGPVNQLLNGNPGISSLAYATASAYQFVAAGASTITFEASAAPGAAIATLPAALTPGTDNSVFVTGFAGATAAFAVVNDNSPPLGGYSGVRIVNTSPNSPPLNVFSGDTTSLVTGLAANTASDELQVVAGAITFTFKDPTTGATVLTLPSVGLAGGQSYSIYVQGPIDALTGLVTPDTP